jgi:hypothetical protein
VEIIVDWLNLALRSRPKIVLNEPGTARTRWESLLDIFQVALQDLEEIQALSEERPPTRVYERLDEEAVKDRELPKFNKALAEANQYRHGDIKLYNMALPRQLPEVIPGILAIRHPLFSSPYLSSQFTGPSNMRSSHRTFAGAPE